MYMVFQRTHELARARAFTRRRYGRRNERLYACARARDAGRFFRALPEMRFPLELYRRLTKLE